MVEMETACRRMLRGNRVDVKIGDMNGYYMK